MVFRGYFQEVLETRQDVEVVMVPDHEFIYRLQQQNRSVFLFHPVQYVGDVFEVFPEAGLYRVGRLRQRQTR
jgi:hypothetical protein